MKLASIVGLAASHKARLLTISGITSSQAARHPLQLFANPSTTLPSRMLPLATLHVTLARRRRPKPFLLRQGARLVSSSTTRSTTKAPLLSTSATLPARLPAGMKVVLTGSKSPSGTFNPFTFTDMNASQLTTTIPANTPAGEYLVRIEQIGLHVAGAPQWYISCAQISITGGGSGNPSKVSIPGYVSPTDPGLTVNIYDPVPTSYTSLGPLSGGDR